MVYSELYLLGSHFLCWEKPTHDIIRSFVPCSPSSLHWPPGVSRCLCQLASMTQTQVQSHTEPPDPLCWEGRLSIASLIHSSAQQIWAEVDLQTWQHNSLWASQSFHHCVFFLCFPWINSKNSFNVNKEVGFHCVWWAASCMMTVNTLELNWGNESWRASVFLYWGELLPLMHSMVNLTITCLFPVIRQIIMCCVEIRFSLWPGCDWFHALIIRTNPLSPFHATPLLSRLDQILPC